MGNGIDLYLKGEDIFTTYSMKEQAEVRELLAQNGIRYRVKTVNRLSPSPVDAGVRARMGSLGNDLSKSYEYIVIVHKDDVERARSILNNRKKN